MAGLTIEERQIAFNYAQNGADFMFMPSTKLCNMIAVGSPETIEINSVLISILLTRQPIRLDTMTVMEYCRGTLDAKNTWLLDHGDIKVVPYQLKRPDLVKKEDDSEENDLEEINYE